MATAIQLTINTFISAATAVVDPAMRELSSRNPTSGAHDAAACAAQLFEPGPMIWLPRPLPEALPAKMKPNTKAKKAMNRMAKEEVDTYFK